MALRTDGARNISELCIVGTKSRSVLPSCHPFPSLPLCATMAHTAAHLVLLSALAIVAAASTAQLETHSGAYSICRANTLYKVEFNVTGVPNDNYIALDDPSIGVVDVDCDYDQTALNLKFDSNDHVLKFVARIVAGGSFKIFVTSKFNFSSCKSLDLTLVRRVVSAEPDASNRVNVQLKAIIANYDELIQDGTISLAPSGPCAPAVDQRFCVGLNVDDACADAKAPIAIHRNPFISITCSDCFTAFVADAFLVIKLSNWKVRPPALMRPLMFAAFSNKTERRFTIF